jgi:hypothetical protein
MHKCRWFPYPIGYPHPTKGYVLVRPDRVLPSAYQFIREWKRRTPPPHHFVLVRCFGEPPVPVYINGAFKHVERKSARDIARRYRFLPCVKELLEESEETPISTKTGTLLLEGKAAPYNETFAVILEETLIAPGLAGVCLKTWYPITR